MKRLLFILLFLSAQVFSQDKIKTIIVSDHSLYLKGNKFEGVIFSEKYFSLLAKSSQRFTPTTNEIIIAEKTLKKNFITITDESNQKIFINKNLKKYYRQYVGYINDKKQKIIFINLFWKTSNDKSWLTDQHVTLDGGNHYCEISFNLNTLQLFNFYVNGEG